MVVTRMHAFLGLFTFCRCTAQAISQVLHPEHFSGITANFRRIGYLHTELSLTDDGCPGTVEGELVDESGCSIAQLCPCVSNWKNHGSYVSCIAHVTDDWLEKGLLTEEEKDAIVSDAAQSDCGKKK